MSNVHPYTHAIKRLALCAECLAFDMKAGGFLVTVSTYLSYELKTRIESAWHI